MLNFNIPDKVIKSRISNAVQILATNCVTVAEVPAETYIDNDILADSIYNYFQAETAVASVNIECKMILKGSIHTILYTIDRLGNLKPFEEA